MNANTSRQNAAAWEEGAQLFDRTTRDLPPGRHQFHKERMMAQIHETRQTEHTATATNGANGPTGTNGATPAKARRFRLSRPAIALPALAATVAAAVIAVVVTSGGESRPGLATGPALTTTIGVASAEGAPRLLDEIALAAADGKHPVAKPGQYIYIESKTADTFVRTVDGESSLASYALHTRQVWESPDGTKGWLIDPAVNDSSEGETLSLPDEQGNTPRATLNAPSYDYLAKLTTDPDTLLAKIYKETEGQGNTPDQQAFATIGDLLGESYPPAELVSALFKAAAKIPGVVVVDDAVDAAGRHGVAVARLDETSGQREEWIFDKKTHVYLGERIVQVNRVSGDDGLIKPGTIVFTSAIMKRAIVDGIKQTPSHSG
ncbi:CU044_5270 family protein [Streptomyces ossamyceticus]|uniref:CU044_5270 family protein n=1 Tax=Streptomyces ossamyceticus TaxID=249581 RepID=UPI00341FE545